MMRRRHFLTLFLLGFLSVEGRADGWKAGTGRETVTPTSPLWMAGYGARNKPSEGEIHSLWVKALVLEDPAGQKLLIVTLDVCGIDGSLSRRIRDSIHRIHGLGDDRIVLASSHTHSGPVLGENLITMYPIHTGEKAKIAAYTTEFEFKIARAIASAFKQSEPCTLSWETGKADFAVNRRNNKEPDVPALRIRNALEGPVDHDVPVLLIRGKSEKKLKMVVYGYACHCTVLSFYKFCGDYVGFASNDLEERYPGSLAMFVAGCGADQNPLPRGTIELARKYGKELADAVAHVVDSPAMPIEGKSSCAYKLVNLRFGTLPIREQIEADAKSSILAVANRAKKLLRTLDSKGELQNDYPYPVQVWKLGDLTWIFLGGEVVVDYSLRLKRNLGSSKTWVSGYCNDVMAYIPSLRVLKEGGYEGASAMTYYGLPTSWSEDVEEQIIEAVGTLLEATKPR